MSILRHLPPTATPLNARALPSSLIAGHEAVEQFCALLRDYLDVEACFLAASGRTALYLILQALQESTDPQRREVVVPSYTCPSVAKVVLDAGLSLRLLDIRPATFAYDLDELAGAVDNRTLAVVVVHPFGIPLPVKPIRQIARQHGAFVIEDAAQSMGASLDGQPVGTIGDIGLLSLGPGKPMSTGGGGIAVTNDAALAYRLRRAWTQLQPATVLDSWLAAVRTGIFSAAFHPTAWWLAYRAGASRMGESEASWGYKLRGYTPSQAVLGTSLLPQLDTLNNLRRSHAVSYTQALHGVQRIEVDPNAKPIYLRYPVLFDRYKLRERAVDELNRAGFGAGRMYRKPLSGYFPQATDGDYPGANRIADTLLTLPTHFRVTDADIAGMAAIVNRIAENHSN